MKRVFLLLIVLSFGCRTAEDVQRDYAKTLKPVQIQSARAPAASASASAEPRAIRPLKVRVYADADFQNQTRKWEARVMELLKRANGLLEPRYGVSLQVESFRHWERADRTVPMESALAELRAVDDAREVDWVIGFVSSLPVFTASQDQLGFAPIFGRHFVLRSMESIGEVTALNRVLEKLPVAEREALFKEQRLHKETTVLLHEWAHTLGGFHNRTVDWLMSPSYSARMSRFDPDTDALIELGLRMRDQRDPGGRAKWGAEYRAYVEKTQSPEWYVPARDEALAAADAVLAGKVSAGGMAKLTNADAARYNEAVKLLRSGKVEEGYALLAPLLTKVPADPYVQSLACDFARRRTPGSPETVAACRRSASALPDESRRLRILASALLEAKDVPGAVDVLEQARAKMIEKKGDPEDWTVLAQLYLLAQMPTRAEEAVDRAPPTETSAKVYAETTRARHWSALPRNAAFVKVEREYEYIGAMAALNEEINADRVDRARQRRGLLAKEFVGAPGLALIDCTLEGRSGKAPAARVRSLCEAAVSAYPDAVFAHHLLGLAAEAERKDAEAVAHFERTIALDPRFEAAWQRLFALYAATKNDKARKDVADRFRAAFGRDP